MLNQHRTTRCHIGQATEDSVYCGRSRHGKRPQDCDVGEEGYFGNPVKLGVRCEFCGEVHKLRGSTLNCYSRWAEDRLHSDRQFRTALADLRGKKLACFCSPGGPCHTEVMVYLIEYAARLKSRRKGMRVNFFDTGSFSNVTVRGKSAYADFTLDGSVDLTMKTYIPERLFDPSIEDITKGKSSVRGCIQYDTNLGQHVIVVLSLDAILPF